jgi:hypothetical protein
MYAANLRVGVPTDPGVDPWRVGTPATHSFHQPNGIELFVETVFYKQSKNAHWNLILLLLGLVFSFIGLAIFDNVLFPIIVVIALFAIPLYAGLTHKGWFSFSSYDERKLRFDSEGFSIGTTKYNIETIDLLKCHLHSYFALRLLERYRFGIPVYTSEYGNENILSYSINKKVYRIKFVLARQQSYLALRKILLIWKSNYPQISFTERYTIDEIVSGRRKTIF